MLFFFLCYDETSQHLSLIHISFAKYDSDYVAKYKENKTSFADVCKDIEKLFGLKTQGEEMCIRDSPRPPLFV